MTAPVGKAPTKTEKPVAEEKQESKIQPSDYSCEILLEKTTEEKASDKSFPTDAYIVRYVDNGTQHLDVTRCYKMVNIFDMYFDKYGKGSLKSIDFGHGTIKPSQYGYKSPEKKKRKRKL
tara:strand:- start:6 stop:365 length:360 start_codon:yes stop_codon:yes gene_type:complete